MPIRRSIRALLCAIPLLIAAAACDDMSGPAGPRIEETEFAPTLGIDLAASTRSPTGLYYRDLQVGTGAGAPAGTAVEVFYTLWLANGTRVETNVGGNTLPFVTGTPGTIAGFDEGVRGMRVGGRRQLIIPPKLGYAGQRKPGIPPHSILIFEVQLVSARS